MTLALLIILSSMFVFVNTIYYTFSLLLVVSALLVFIVSINSLSTLTMLMFLIVYVGAIMILIGYVCAVSPNLISQASIADMFYILPLVGLFWLLSEENSWIISYSTADQISNFFYSVWGLFFFVVIALMLFVVLLIVTSQYVSPKGPFRSVSL